MQLVDKSFLKKLNQCVCNKVFEKSLVINSTEIKMFIFIKEIEFKKDKICLKGIRVAGYMVLGRLYPTKTELADIEYKMFISYDGIVSYILKDSLWIVLLSRFKHFDIDKEDLKLDGKIQFMKTKRFFKHTLRYLPLY